MESAYLKLASGSRLSNYLGLQMREGYAYRYGKHYLYIEIPVAAIAEGEAGSLQVKRNQHVFVESAATLEIRGNQIVEIEPNPELAQYGQIQGNYKLHPGSTRQVAGFWFTARKDIDLSTLEYAVRIYMYA